MNEYVKFFDELNPIVRLILLIIPFTSWINAIIYRFAKGNLLGAILAIPFGTIFWIIDLVSILVYGKIKVLA